MSLFLFVLFLCSAVFAADDADKVFADKNYGLARDLYVRNREISYGKRQDEDWKRATVQIVRCSTALGDTERAVQEYFLLCRKEKSPPLEFIPLPWFVPMNRTVGFRPHEKAAEDYLNEVQNPCSAGKFLAAAVLSVCTDNAKRIRGNQVLRELSAISVQENAPDDGQKQIVLLAAVFLWKQRIPGFRNASDLTPLQKVLERIPEPQRAGPYFLLAEVAAQVREDETAVLYWMRIPILFPENRPLAAESLRRSAETLEKLGRIEQANLLRSEMNSVP